jgi:hypothetical protein
MQTCRFPDTPNSKITFETSFASRAASLWFPTAMAFSNLTIMFSAETFGMLPCAFLDFKLLAAKKITFETSFVSWAVLLWFPTAVASSF